MSAAAGAIGEDESAVIWHDVECGSYVEDLPTWDALARRAGGEPGGGADILDLGAGTGRISRRLAEQGHRVCALDSDTLMIDAIRRRAPANMANLTSTVADARSFELSRRFDLILAPMQLAQLFEEDDRRAIFERIAAHLAPEGMAAIAIMDETPAPWRAGAGEDAPLPDVTERASWVFSSLPEAIEADGDGIVVHRRRQIVSPAGDLHEEEHVFRLLALTAEGLERELASAGLRALERLAIAETSDHVGSTVVVCGHPR